MRRIIAETPPGQATGELVRQGGTSWSAAILLALVYMALVATMTVAAHPTLFGFVRHNSGTAIAASSGSSQPVSKPTPATQLKFGSWRPTSGTTSRGTKYCAVGAAVENDNMGQNVFVKGYAGRDSITVDLYKDSWNFRSGSEVPVVLDVRTQEGTGLQETLSAYADGRILDVEVPLASAGNFLMDLAASGLRVIFPSGTDVRWILSDAGADDAVGNMLPCLDSISSTGQDARAMIVRTETLNDICRGGSGSDADTQKACRAREEPAEVLTAMGYCYGKDGQSESEYEWHHCGPGSLK